MSFGERFLAVPDLFPARRGGEPWGDREVSLDLPGGPYAVAGLSPAQAEAARERFGEICGQAGPPPAVRGRVFTAAAADFLTFDTRGWEYSMDFAHGERSLRLAGLELMARLDWTPDLTGALWTSEEGEHFPGIFENFLRVLVAYRLVDLGGVVLHCAGVVDGPGAFLFLGPSGAGKTTLSRLSEETGRTVLSDDLNALLPAPPGASAPRVVKLPFTGDLGDRRQGGPALPLRGLLRLEKGAVDSLRALSSGETLALLFACSPFVNADPYRRDNLLGVLARLAGAGPAWELTFSLTGRFWGILDQEIP
ncbi:MAG TPA: hypothetical protein VMM92_12280 [Thermoanaerobaculia bacterium]|nr:hypothetical protein [Thermoanaerobaculia bacterium]